MAVFPYALVRLAGLPWSLLQRETTGIQDPLQALQSATSNFVNHQSAIAQALRSLHQTTNDYPLKAKLTTRIVRIVQGKSAKSIASLSGHLSSTVFSEFQALQTSYSDARQLLREAKQQFEVAYEALFAEQRQAFLLALQSSAIWQDLAFIHPGLAQRANRLVESSDQYNKKQRQTWRSLLKVATRSAAKTSPFAHFGPLAWAGTDIERSIDWQLNQWIHHLLRKTLSAADDFEMKFQIAPSLMVDGPEYVYVQQKENKEQMHRIEAQPILQLIIEILEKESRTLSLLQKELLEQTDSDDQGITQFLNQLIGIGFLTVDWPVASNDLNWLEKWLPHLPEGLKEPFGKMHQILMDQNGQGSKTTIAALQQHLQETLSRALPNLSDDEKLKDQRLVFCNVIKPSVPILPEWTNRFQTATEKLQRILDFVLLNPDLASINQFYAIHGNEAEWPLLKFHEAYHRHKPYDLTKEYQAAASRQKALFDLLKSIPQDNPAQIVIPQSEIDDFIASNNISASHAWRGVIIQKGEAEHYLTHTFLGHGKMLSRFLTQKSSRITEAVVHKNNQLDYDAVEAIDENFFSANLHPRLTGRVVDWQHRTTTDQQIAVKDLIVCRDGDQLQLRHQPSGKRVCPIQYGFQALELRSPLFQTLSALGPVLNDIDPFRQLLREAFTQNAEGVERWPRIALDNGLVLLRKGWRVASVALLSVLDIPAAAERWLALRKWQSEQGLPDQVFFALQRSGAAPKDDHYKPQYFDFSKPLFMPLLKFIAAHRESQLMIEEVYPAPPKSNDPYSGYAQEWVIEYLDEGS